jgi:hypothetical protein
VADTKHNAPIGVAELPEDLVEALREYTAEGIVAIVRLWRPLEPDIPVVDCSRRDDH